MHIELFAWGRMRLQIYPDQILPLVYMPGPLRWSPAGWPPKLNSNLQPFCAHTNEALPLVLVQARTKPDCVRCKNRTKTHICSQQLFPRGSWSSCLLFSGKTCVNTLSIYLLMLRKLRIYWLGNDVRKHQTWLLVVRRTTISLHYKHTTMFLHHDEFKFLQLSAKINHPSIWKDSIKYPHSYTSIIWIHSLSRIIYKSTHACL